jgi:acetolactate synthase-1/2/3 large subunit
VTTQTVTGADILVRELQARGVSWLGVLCGNGLDSLLYAAQRAGVRLVDMRNEQSASFMADAYARLSGQVGVCAVSSGVAHVHGLAGVLNAQYDGAPLLLISGSSPAAKMGRGVFQDLDQVGLARPLCKRAELVLRPERIAQAVQESLAVATSGRPGPVHLTIPADVLSAAAPAQASAPISASTRPMRQRAAADPERVREAVELLAEAQRPLIVAGSGAFYDDAGTALLQLSRVASIPIVTPIWDRGVIDSLQSSFLGVIGAASGEPPLLPQADLLLMVGARVDYRVRYLDTPPLAPDLRVVRISPDAAELGQGGDPHVAILADCRSALEQLVAAWPRCARPAHEAWLHHAQELHSKFYAPWTTRPELKGSNISGAQLVAALEQVVDDETIFLVDGGNIGQWAHMTLCRNRYPSHWLTCGASGLVGWGVAGAMAARLHAPDRPVILLSGDGALGFGLMEFESAARQGIPFVAVVADDHAWGIVVSGQQKSCGATAASVLGDVDYAAVARALGGEGIRVDRAEEIVPAVRQALTTGKPTLVQVPLCVGGPADGS